MIERLKATKFDIEERFSRTFLLREGEFLRYIVKHIPDPTFESRGFVIEDPITNWVFLRSRDLTKSDGLWYEIIEPKGDLIESSVGPFLWERVLGFYKSSGSIRFISDIKHSGIERYTGLLTKRGPHFAKIYGDQSVCSMGWEILGKLSQYARSYQSLPSGFVHGDLYYRNILVDGSKCCYLIDFDDAHYSYLLFNLAEFFYISYGRDCALTKSFSECIPSYAFESLKSLSKVEREKVPFLVGLIAFRWEIETVVFEREDEAERVLLLKERYENLLGFIERLDRWMVS